MVGVLRFWGFFALEVVLMFGVFFNRITRVRVYIKM